MLKAHLSELEKVILAQANIQANTGHPIHKGIPREIFIKKFLQCHYSENVSFDTGEIIDSLSKPGERRHQIDIVMHKKDSPKLHFGGDISAFLAESVIAAIEVKSTLDEKGFRDAYTCARDCKKLKRSYFEALKMWYDPPAIQNFIIAYDGPSKMKTVYDWIKKLDEEFGVEYPDMPSLRTDRIKIPSPSIDGVFILGKGFLHFDNFLISNFSDEDRKRYPNMKWLFGNSENNNLFVFFMNLTQSISSYNQKVIDIMAYLENTKIEVKEYQFGF